MGLASRINATQGSNPYPPQGGYPPQGPASPPQQGAYGSSSYPQYSSYPPASPNPYPPQSPNPSYYPASPSPHLPASPNLSYPPRSPNPAAAPPPYPPSHPPSLHPGYQYPNQSGYPPYPGATGVPGALGVGPAGSPNLGGAPGNYAAYRPGQTGPPGPPGQAPPMASAQIVPMLLQSMQETARTNRLDAFYPPNQLQQLNAVASRAAASVDQLCQAWRLPREIGFDIVKLGLYDIILYVDDSGSMAFEESGERIKDLKVVLERVTYASSLLDEDGISVRFMNSNIMTDHIKTNAQVDTLINSVQFKGLTPMGTELKNKVLSGVVRQAQTNQLKKPVLVIVLTDGVPAGEPREAVFDTIKWAHNEVSRTVYGPGAIAFQFAQIGNDQKAREFLGKLDEDPQVGHLIDCTSNYENESLEMSQLSPPVDLTPELWLVKLLLGAIDHSYDRKDEKPGSQGPPAGGLPGQHPGAAPYGQQQPYGQYPPQGQYPPGQQPPPGQKYPPPGQQYPPQGQQYPPQGQQYPPQGQQYGQAYGQPPQQQQYAQPPQGQYGQPPQGQYGQQYGQPRR